MSNVEHISAILERHWLFNERRGARSKIDQMSNEKIMNQIKLGNRVRDIVTGFEGIAVTRLEYLDGGREIGVRAEASKKDSSLPKMEYIAEVQLQKVDDGIYVAPVTRAIGFNAEDN